MTEIKVPDYMLQNEKRATKPHPVPLCRRQAVVHRLLGFMNSE